MVLSLILSMFLLSCNEFNPTLVGYEDPDPSTEVPATPPVLEASWKLELITNVGQHNSKVFVYKDKKYDELFTRTLGWNGGDGVLSTLLPDGNTFWSFNDSFYGVVAPQTRARGNCSFPRNSLMVQKGENSDADLVWLADYVQTSDPVAPRYYQARTHLRHPDATLSEAQIADGDIDQDYLYWAGDGTVYSDAGVDVFQMTWAAVDNTDPANLMRRFGTALAEYSLIGEPGGPDYMKLINVEHNFNDNDFLGFGSTLYEDQDGHTYLYANYNYNTYVARTTTRDLKSPWEYYVRDVNGDFNWQTTYPTDTEYKRSHIQTTASSMPWVFKKDDTYYMIGQSMWFGHAMYIYRSDKPYGPFVDQKTLFVVPNTLDKLGEQYYNHLYMVNLHPQLSRDGELVFSTNTDCLDFWDNFNREGSADYYRPYFFRVYNWVSLYTE